MRQDATNAAVTTTKAVGGSIVGEPRPFRITGISSSALDPAGNRIALAFLERVQGVRAQRAAPSRKRAAGRRQADGSHALFDPVDDRGERIEAVERRWTVTAMSHAGRQEQTVPGANLLGPSIRLRHTLVVGDRVERREPGKADATPEDQLAAMA